MQRTAQIALLMLVAVAASATAQTTTQSPPANARRPSITGVPRYRAGFRGQRGTTAPLATGDISITGKGDHTGTGGGTGMGPGSLELPRPGNALGVPSGTIIHVRIRQAIDSGHAHNGDMLDGELVSAAGSAPAGSPVKLTVVAVAAAGTMTGKGEISVQVVSINGQDILTNVVTAIGEDGKTILADDAPTRGTEAVLTTDKPIDLPIA